MAALIFIYTSSTTTNEPPRHFINFLLGGSKWFLKSKKKTKNLSESARLRLEKFLIMKKTNKNKFVSGSFQPFKSDEFK